MSNNKKDSLGDRMKENYENRSKTYLVRRTPVIIRLDGKSFHTFTKGFKRPYDEIFHAAMNNTLKYLCENIQGCKFGYTQSDEITLLLMDDDTLTTDAFFDYNVQKVCSITASMATMAFNYYFQKLVCDVYNCNDWPTLPYWGNAIDKDDFGYFKMAMFDSRCFNISKEEIENCFIWRQQDATRNAIQMLGQTNFSHKELQGKSCNDIQDMLMLQKGINFNDMPTEFKRGVCCVKEIYYPAPAPGYEDCDIDASTARTRWVIDKNIPIFTQDRLYIYKSIEIAKNI
jgi:tRNA(His) 5'-end guanylyltransferase